MSLFEKAGRKFEETKRSFVDGDDAEDAGGGADGPEDDAADGPAYVCRSCEEPVSEAYEYCPHCGEASVESVE